LSGEKGEGRMGGTTGGENEGVGGGGSVRERGGLRAGITGKKKGA